MTFTNISFQSEQEKVNDEWKPVKVLLKSIKSSLIRSYFLLCPLIMRQAKCSAPIPPRGSSGVRRKICVTKKRGAQEYEVKKGRGTWK